MQFRYSILLLSAGVLIAAGCKKKADPTTPAATKGTMEVNFENKAGDADLEFNKWYTTTNGDSFTVTMFKYYISNIVLTAEDGSTYTEANSYHLVDESDNSSQAFKLPDVPNGKYKSITFIVGVDSMQNVSGAGSGALDQVYGMYWSWNSGYIMAKLEGTSPKAVAIDNPNGLLVYHVGGFMGENRTPRTVTINFGHAIEINNNSQHVHIIADVKKWFHGAHQINLAINNRVHMPGAAAKLIADNYAMMFSEDDHH